MVGGGISGGFNEVARKTTGFGLLPTFGINYKIYKQFFIGLESNLNILFVAEDKTISSSPTYSSPITTIFSKNRFSENIFNPIVLMVTFKF